MLQDITRFDKAMIQELKIEELQPEEIKEELEKYEPSLDIEQVSEVVNNSNNMTDVTDIMRELIAEVKGTM